MSDTKDNNVASLIAGIVIGAAATYLLTNPEGKKLKENLLKEGALLLEKVTHEVEETKEKVQEVQEEVKSTAEATQKVIETASEEIAQVAQAIPTQIEEIQKKGRRLFFHKRPTPPATES